MYVSWCPNPECVLLPNKIALYRAAHKFRESTFTWWHVLYRIWKSLTLFLLHPEVSFILKHDDIINCQILKFLCSSAVIHLVAQIYFTAQIDAIWSELLTVLLNKPQIVNTVYMTVRPSIVIEWLTLLLPTQEVLGSNLHPYTGCHDCDFLWFSSVP